MTTSTNVPTPETENLAPLAQIATEAVANALGSTSVEEATLDAGIAEVQKLFQSTETNDALARDAFEERHAELIGTGYKNAQALLAARAYLYRKLTAIGLKPETNDIGKLLGQIAKLQLGHSETKDGKTTWKVTSRRDERMGRFYRIFNEYPEKFPLDQLEAKILAHKGRTNGILDWKKGVDDEAKKRPQAELDREEEEAIKTAPLASVVLDTAIATPANGRWQLALVEVGTSGKVNIRKMINGQEGLAKRECEAWAREVAVAHAASVLLTGGQPSVDAEA